MNVTNVSLSILVTVKLEDLDSHSAAAAEVVGKELARQVADYEKEKAGKTLRDIVRNTESITGNTEGARKRLWGLTRAAIQTKRVTADEMLILQECEDEVKDIKPVNEKGCKKMVYITKAF